MIITSQGSGGDFELPPEEMTQAVCVDITPLKEVETDYGIKKKFRIVFELDVKEVAKKDGTPFYIWTQGFVPSLHERASLRKFLKSWRGRDFSPEELAKGFDVETLLGKCCTIIVKHNTFVGRDGAERTFANIDYIGKPRAVVEPTGVWTRIKDREPAAGTQGTAGTAPNQEPAPAQKQEPAKPAPAAAVEPPEDEDIPF